MEGDNLIQACGTIYPKPAGIMITGWGAGPMRGKVPLEKTLNFGTFYVEHTYSSYSFNKDLLSTYCILGTVLGSGDE